jgi:hypothetical protein
MKENKKRPPNVPINPPNVPKIGQPGGQTGSQTGAQTVQKLPFSPTPLLACAQVFSKRIVKWRRAMASERSTACFSEIRASAMGSEGALRNGGSDRGLKQRRRRGSGSGSAAEIDRAATVRARLRRKLILSQANIDTEKSLEKRLVFVICVILIDSLFWGFVAKI